MVRVVTLVEDLLVTILEGIIDRIMRKRYPLYDVKDFERNQDVIVQQVDEMVIEPEPDAMTSYGKRVDEEGFGVPHEVLEAVAEDALDERLPTNSGADITVLYPQRIQQFHSVDQSINQVIAQPDTTTQCFNSEEGLTVDASSE